MSKKDVERLKRKALDRYNTHLNRVALRTMPNAPKQGTEEYNAYKDFDLNAAEAERQQLLKDIEVFKGFETAAGISQPLTMPIYGGANNDEEIYFADYFPDYDKSLDLSDGANSKALIDSVNPTARLRELEKQINTARVVKAADLENNPDWATKSWGTDASVKSLGSNSKWLTPEEQRRYNYIYNTQGLEAAGSYIAGLEKEMQNRKVQSLYDFADRQPVTGSVASLGTQILAALEAGVDLTTYFMSAGLSQSDAVIAAKYTEALRSGASADFDTFGKFLYNTGMSGADSFIASLMSFIPGGAVVGAAGLGLSAAGSAINDVLERGGTYEQAMTSGFYAGLFEALFEKVSIGSIKGVGKWLDDIDFASVKDIVKKVGGTMGINATEEMATEVANIVFDDVFMGELSNSALKIEEYIAQGMSPEEAKSKVLMETLGQVGQAGASGALMGAGFFAGGAGVHYGGKGIAKGYNAVKSKITRKDTKAVQQRLNELNTEAKQSVPKAVSNAEAAAQTATLPSTTSPTTADISKTSVRPIVQADGQKLSEIYVEQEDGSLVSLEQLSIEDTDLAMAYSYAATTGSVESANAFVKAYVASGENASPTQFWTAWMGIASSGQTLRTTDETMKKVFAEYGDTLSEETKLAAWLSGVEMKKTASERRVEAAEKAKAQWEKDGKKVVKGKIDASALQGVELDDKQKEFVAFGRLFAEAFGMNVRFVASPKGNRGDNGSYNRKTNTITIDVFSGIGNDANYNAIQSALSNTLSHEVVHNMRVVAPAQYDILSEYVFETLKAQGMDIEAQIRYQQEQSKDGKMSRADAIEEVVAHACDGMLQTSATVREFMEGFYAKDKRAANRFKQAVRDVLKRLKAVFDSLLGTKAYSEEARTLYKAGDDVIAEIQKLFDEGVLAMREGNLARNYEVQGAMQPMTSEAATITADGTILLQQRQYRESGRASVLKYLTEQYGEATAEDMIFTMDKLYDVVDQIKDENPELNIFSKWQETEVELDDEGHPIFSSNIKNGDYPLNQDFSRVCKKRRQLDEVLNWLASNKDFTVAYLTKDDYKKINDIIKKHGFEVACDLCFVDAKRFRQSEWAESFAETWNDLLKSVMVSGNATAFNFATDSMDLSATDVVIDASKPISYRKWSDGKVSAVRSYKNLDDFLKNDGNANVKNMMKLIVGNAEMRHTFRAADIIASKGFDTIQRNAPEIRQILNGWGGSSAPKTSSLDAVYDNSILNIAGYNKKSAEAVGGVRMNSFSDFIAHMFFDYCQAFADLSAKELPMQSYSKELVFHILFGKTGGKLNMSGIPAARKPSNGKYFKPDVERQFAGLDVEPLAKYLGKAVDKLTVEDCVAHLDMLEYQWAQESIDVKKATLLQSGIRFDKLVKNENGKEILDEAKIDRCYELIKEKKFSEAHELAGKENVDLDYTKHLGIIVVGVSEPHIRKLLRDHTIRMVIPYHASGINPNIAKALHIDTYENYTNDQSTKIQYKGENARNLTKGDGIEPFHFYDYFGKTVDGVFYDAKATAQRYIDWCAEMSTDEYTVIPKFSQFTDEENYYKLLEDFDCYNTITEEHEQQNAVSFFGDSLPADYKQVLVNALKEQQGKSDAFKAALDATGMRGEILNVVKKRGFNPDADEMKQFRQDTEYLDAVNRGDMKTAQKMVDEAAKEAGYTVKAYHGTRNNFNVFDSNRNGTNYDGWSKYGKGFYFAVTAEEADQWSAKAKGIGNKRTVNAYLRMEKPFILNPSEYENIENMVGKMDNLADYVQEEGYDGIISPSQYVVFNSNQVKSADTVTYDDNGNVIPLSERFNAKVDDIRYQARRTEEEKTLTKADVEKSFEAIWDALQESKAFRKYDNVKDFLQNETDYEAVDWYAGAFDFVDAPTAFNNVIGLFNDGTANWKQEWVLGDILEAYQNGTLDKFKLKDKLIETPTEAPIDTTPKTWEQKARSVYDSIIKQLSDSSRKKAPTFEEVLSSKVSTLGTREAVYKIMRLAREDYEAAKTDRNNAYRVEAAINVMAYNLDSLITHKSDRYQLSTDQYGDVMKQARKERFRDITLEDIETLRSINRKSINKYTSADISKAEMWAEKFFKDLGVKSPFFRAWYGDWRKYEKDTFVDVPTMDRREGKNPRGQYKNEDTQWIISSSSVGYDETVSHSGRDKKSLIAMRNIDKIIKNAVLLDTETSEYGRGKKSIYTAFMHKFYSLVKIDGKVYLAKMAVDESFSPGQDETIKKFYHVRAIEIEMVSSVGIGFNHTPIIEDTISNISIANLFEVVKRVDKDFSPNPVNEALLNKDGTPKVVYHGTNADFTEFDLSKSSDTTKRYIDGFYFTTEEKVAKKIANLVAKSRGGDANVLAVYLDVKNPLVLTAEEYQKIGFNEKWRNEVLNKLTKGKHDGVIIKPENERVAGVFADSYNYEADANVYYNAEKYSITNKDYAWWLNRAVSNPDFTATQIAVFKPEQIKSATDNIGTYDKGNTDILHQKRISTPDPSTILKDVIRNKVGAKEYGKYTESLKKYQDLDVRVRNQEKRIAEIDKEIKVLKSNKAQSGKGARMDELYRQRKTAENKAEEYRNRMFALETKELSGIVKAETEKARITAQREAKARYHESVVSRHKTEKRNRLRKIVNELNTLFAKGNKKKNVKPGLADTVEKALQLSQVLAFTDIGNDEVILSGLITSQTDAEQKIIDKYKTVLEEKERLEAEIDELREQEDVDNEAEIKELRNKVTKLNAEKREYADSLRDLLEREKRILSKKKVGTIVDELAKAYSELQNAEKSFIRQAYNEATEERIKKLATSLETVYLKDMTEEQLDEIVQVYRAVLKTVKDANKAFVSEKGETYTELANSTKAEIRARGEEKDKENRLAPHVRKFMLSNSIPVWFFDTLRSNTLIKLFTNLANAEDNWAVLIKDGQRYKKDVNNKYGVKKWDFDKTFSFTLRSGKKAEVTLGQLFSLYAYAKQGDEALGHLYNGGFVYAKSIILQDGTKKHKKWIVRPGSTFRLDEITLAEMFAKMEEAAPGASKYIDEMVSYLSGELAQKGNDTAEKLYGIRLFNKEYYFPITSSSDFIRSKEQKSAGQAPRLKNWGATNERVAKANNPIVLDSFEDIWAKHVSQMASFATFTLPLEDMERVVGYSTRADEENNAESVKGVISTVLGREYIKYIDDLIDDLNGGARVDDVAGYMNTFMGLAKTGATALSMSTLVQQPTSMFRAMAFIDPKYFATSRAKLVGHKKEWAELQKYAPVAIIKEMGGYDTGLGAKTAQYLKSPEYDTFGEIAVALIKDSSYRNEVIFKAPALADEITWCYIWAAVKKEVAATNKALQVGSEAYYKACGERFEYVIRRTQVYDSVLARSPLMRSKNPAAKMVTAFASEPTVFVNMGYGAVDAVQHKEIKRASRILVSSLASIITNAIVSSFVYAARDDDDDETYTEKYIQSFTTELIEGLNPLTYVPFLRDIWSIMLGYDIERLDVSVIVDVWNAFEGIFSSRKTPLEKITTFLGKLSTIFGVPLNNLIRESKATINLFKLMVNFFSNGDHTDLDGIIDALQEAGEDSVPLLDKFI